MKEIGKVQLNKLLETHILQNTCIGYVNVRGNMVGVYRTCSGKYYIEDYYIDSFERLTQNSKSQKDCS